MAEHTPGPWAAHHRHIHAGPHDDEMGGLGWEVAGPEEPMRRGMFAKAADAYLVAAAPDLLAACEAVAAYVDRWGSDIGHDAFCDTVADDNAACDCGMDRVRAAIAKARGQEGSE